MTPALESPPATPLQALVRALRKAGHYNDAVQAAPAVILWTDADRQWHSALGPLRNQGLLILQLGEYRPDRFQGPALWLKCALAGVLPEVPRGETPPVLYLPGVSRADLGAIESCPRHLQPLAELPYRGAWFSQTARKDWTLNAFLGSKNGGLGLSVAKDKATQEALVKCLEAGALLDHPLQDLEQRAIQADWLRSLLVQNPERDLLAWMDKPDQAQSEWSPQRWDAFQEVARAEFGLDLVKEGALSAAERLAQARGRWTQAWELYQDAHARYRQVRDLLGRLTPPILELFDDPAVLANYPAVNDRQEGKLRQTLQACADLGEQEARAAVLAAEEAHGLRRGWLWARRGEAPLARALEHLARLALDSAHLPAGADAQALARSYAEGAWRVDQAALLALGAVSTTADLQAVGAAVRALYLPWLHGAAERFQQALRAGRPPREHRAPEPGQSLCTVFVDGLRYDVAARLRERLEGLGQVDLGFGWTSLPSVTASGKPWCSPVAHRVAGNREDLEFQPRVAGQDQPLNAHHLRKLLRQEGWQHLAGSQTGDPSGRAWTECGDLDHYGHEHGLRLARDLDHQLDQVAERLRQLAEAGWKHLRLVTDHGWLLVPGGLPKCDLPMHQVETRWGRCAVLKDTSQGTPLTFPWDWCPEVQVAYAPGVHCFVAGHEYAHGGLSLQECLVPVLDLRVAGPAQDPVRVSFQKTTWKGLRCLVEVAPDLPGLRVDLRAKPALAESTLLSGPKPLEGGKANLAVLDDAHEGCGAVLVVLDAAGQVLQKAATVVGG